jgi:DnaJ-class molecular chaperone
MEIVKKCKECNGKGMVGVESGLKHPAPEFIIGWKCPKCSETDDFIGRN